MADHPRSRGVYFHPRSHLARFAGSSPLARGLRLRECLHRQVARIIPARAGFTGTGSLSQLTISDHPRSRGVYWNQHELQQRNRGSSPLARGLPINEIELRRAFRIIPARAGFTRSSRSRSTRLRDHPRSRGVYAAVSTSDEWSEGSSPLARGLLKLKNELRSSRGIIPARAGFTFRVFRSRRTCRDHPRSRGVYARLATLLRAMMGSSPLARGLLDVHIAGLPRNGIIPARAGFTQDLRGREAPSADHPRSRGVYQACSPEPDSTHGSSPLARGLHTLGYKPPTIPRIIPARAGFTDWCCLRRCRCWDHPRSRGVYVHLAPPMPQILGSSPLARGLPKEKTDAAIKARIIPARAGFTSTSRRCACRRRDHPRSRGVYT